MSPESIGEAGRPMKRLGMSVLLLLVASVAGLFGYQYYVDHGPRPDVVVEGRVVDAATGSPLEDVFVQINIRQFVGGWGHGHSGCLAGHVVRTDAQGRFHFRKPFRELIPSTQKKNGDTPSPRLGFYKPGWMTEKDHPWFLTSEGPDFRMVSDRKSFSERGLDIKTMLDGACTYKVQGQGWPELWAAIFDEGYATYCDETKALWSDLSTASFYAARSTMWHMTGYLAKQPIEQRELWHRMSEQVLEWYRSDRKTFEVKFDGFAPFGAGITEKDKQRFCAIFRPGQERSHEH